MSADKIFVSFEPICLAFDWHWNLKQIENSKRGEIIESNNKRKQKIVSSWMLEAH